MAEGAGTGVAAALSVSIDRSLLATQFGGKRERTLSTIAHPDQ